VTTWAAQLGNDQPDTETHLSHEQIVARVENRVPDRDQFAVEAHLKGCACCRADVADLKLFRRDPRARPKRWPWVISGAIAAALVAAVWISRSPAPPAPSRSRFELPANWPAADRALVERAINAGALPLAPLPPELATKPGTLLGPAAPAEFAVVSPVGAIVYPDRPEFRWSPLPGVASYRVEVYDSDFQLVVRSASTGETSWTPAQPLARGKIYRWQVVAAKGRETVTVPSPPAAEARFSVLDQATAARIEHARASPNGHLLAAVLFAHAGMPADALRELEALEPELRDSPPIIMMNDRAQ